MYEGYCQSEAAAPPVVALRTAPAWRAMAWPLFLLVGSGAAWGITFSLARMATTAGAHPLGITLWQGLFGGLVLLAIALKRGKRPSLSRRHLGFYLICGLLGTVVPGTLYFYAASRVPAGVLSITIAAVPIFTFAAALVFRVDRLAWGRSLGLICGLSGVLLIVLPETSLPSPAMVPWVLVAVLACACYATENMYVALRSPPGSDAIATVGAMLLMASLVLLPIVFATGSYVPFGFPWGEIEWAVLGIMAVNALAYAVFFHLIQTAGPVFAAQMAYVVTLSGVAWGIAIYGEQHSLWVWGALALMLIGLFLVTPHPSLGQPAAREAAAP